MCKAATSRGLFREDFCKSWKESLKRPLSHFIEDFGGFFFLKDRVTVHWENVAGSADAKALTKEGKFCLRLLTKLYAFMHGTDETSQIFQSGGAVSRSVTWQMTSVFFGFRSAPN